MSVAGATSNHVFQLETTTFKFIKFKTQRLIATYYGTSASNPYVNSKLKNSLLFYETSLVFKDFSKSKWKKNDTVASVLFIASGLL